MFNKTEILSTLSKVAFIILFFILIMLVSLGIDLDFSKLLEPKYWVSIFIQLFFVMVTFNTVSQTHSQTKARNKQGRFYNSYQTNRLKVFEIEEKHLYEELSEAVEKENQELYKQKCLNHIHKISSRIGYQDVIDNIDNLDELCDKYKITGKRVKRLKKVANKVVSGEYSYKKIKENMFLNDKQINKNEESLIAFSVVKNKLFGNGLKIAVYLTISILMQILVYQLVMVNFWTWFISNITLFISSIVSGFQEANREIRLLTAMYEERNSFLKKHLGLNMVYESE